MAENFTLWRNVVPDSQATKAQKAAAADANVDPDSKAKEIQQEGAAIALLENFKGHQGKGEKAVIPASIFDKNLDTNSNGTVDKDEVLSWLEKMDKLDGEDGKISSATASINDKFDLLGFKSSKTESLQNKSTLKSSEKGLEALNDWAGSSIAMFFAETKIIKGMGTKQSIDYITTNKSTKKLFAQTKSLNEDLVKKIFIKAYGEEEGSKKFDELH